MNKEVLRDRIFGCWLGKNTGGTIGAPVEGWRNLPMLPMVFPEQNEPNDDLDLQLLWLNMLEKCGPDFTYQDLAKAWRGTFFRFDEYGIAVANMERGIMPPASGVYNNYFFECMGCPIRSEIWATAAAGMPDTAAYFAMMDATVDHGGESVYAEIFFAVMESLAYTADNGTDALPELIRKALDYIPEDCAVRQAVEYVCQHVESMDMQTMRAELIKMYDRGNFSHCLINIAFTVAALLYGKGGFLETMVHAANFAFDADCTAATAGAILGILLGEKEIRRRYPEQHFDCRIVTCGVKAELIPAMPASIDELTDRTLACWEIVRNLPNPPVLGKNYKTNDETGLPGLNRSFRIGVFANRDEAEQAAPDQWKTVASDTDCIDLDNQFVPDGKKLYVKAVVRAPGVTEPLRLSPDVNAPTLVWLDGEQCGELPAKHPFAPSPHRSWAVGKFQIVPEQGITVLTEINVSAKTPEPLTFCILAAREDKSHEIRAEITAE